MSFDHDSNRSRRRVLQAGLLSGLGAALPGSLFAADIATLPVIYKKIPSTGQKIPAVGVGMDQLGVLGDYNVLRDILKRMHEMGGTVIDTAHRYGDTEIMIGKALKELGLSKKMFIDTKFNRVNARNDEEDRIGGQASIDLSFQRLPRIDLMFIHFISAVDEMMPMLLDLKKHSHVRYIGVTNVPSPKDNPKLVEYMQKYPIDFIQLAYSLGDRDVEKEVLPTAHEHKVAVQVGHPLGRNSLLKFTKDRPLPDYAADFDIGSWSQFLLKYVISHPAVTCAIPGTTKVEHLEDNMGACHGRLPDPDTRKRMEATWAQVVAA